MPQPDDPCIFCGNSDGAMKICLEHAVRFNTRFEDKSDRLKVLSEICYFCSPILPIPGSPLKLVIKKDEESSISICSECVEKEVKEKLSPGMTGRILEFPSK